MTVNETITDSDRRKGRQYHFDRHTPQYRLNFESITEEMQEKCPMAWSDTYDGHWVAAGAKEVFELARCPHVSNDHDVNNERRGYQGISIPPAKRGNGVRGGVLEMDGEEHQFYRELVNPYMSPAAIKRWVPFIDDIVRACLNEKIEEGHIDFVDDLANIAPAVFTLAILGFPLKKWTVYCEPVHAAVYTPEHDPDSVRVAELHRQMGLDLLANYLEIKENPRPGIVNGLAQARRNGEPISDLDALSMIGVVIGGGFDTTTALTAHTLEWLWQHPDERERLSRERDTLFNHATEEFLRYFTPAPGDGRTFAEDADVAGVRVKEGERLWLSWAMANRDPSMFDEPNRLIMERRGNRHFSFGLGVHRCIGSHVARAVYKSMITAVLDRMPDYACEPEGAVHYDTIGVIQGMRHLPAHFTPGPRIGPGLDETLEKLQRICDEQECARPITERTETVVID